MKSKLIRKIRSEKIVVTFILIVLISSLSVGFALFQTDLTVSSDVTFLGVTKHNGDFNITALNCVNTRNAVCYSNGYNRNEVSSGVNLIANVRVQFNGSDPFAAYYVDFYNDTDNYYTYDGFDGGAWFNGISVNTPKVLNKAKGDLVSPGEKFSLLLIYYYDGSVNAPTETWTSANFKFLEGKQTITRGSFIGAVNPKKFTVKDGDTMFKSSINISNNYDISLGVHIRSTNPNILVVDENGNEHDYYFNINKSASVSSDFYLKFASPLESDDDNTEIFLELDDGDNIKCGHILFTKDGSQEIDHFFDYVKDAEASGKLTPYYGWWDHFEGSVSIKNIGSSALANFTVFIKVNDKYKLNQQDSWGPNGYYTVIDGANNLIKIHSINMWNQSMDVIIPPNGTREFTGMNFNISGVGDDTSDVFESIIVKEGLIANE